MNVNAKTNIINFQVNEADEHLSKVAAALLRLETRLNEFYLDERDDDLETIKRCIGLASCQVTGLCREVSELRAYLAGLNAAPSVAAVH